MVLTTQVDPIELKEQVSRQYLDHGYSRRNRRDEEVVDDTPMKARVYEAVKKKIARGKEEIAKNSYTNGEIYALAFPDAPGTNPKTTHLLTDLDSAIRSALMRKVWGLTQPRYIGYVQKRLGTEALGLVLCRTTSFRGLDDVEVCFVTDNEELIMSESVLPQIETLVRKADDLRLHAEMVMARKPELRNRVTRELGLGVRRVEAGLGVRRVEAALPQSTEDDARSAA